MNEIDDENIGKYYLVASHYNKYTKSYENKIVVKYYKNNDCSLAYYIII